MSLPTLISPMPPRGTNLAPARKSAFTRAMRLTHERQYDAIYLNKLRKTAHPLVVFFQANSLPHPRLGLAVHRRLGTAVLRNQLKRRMRDAFKVSLALLAHADGRNLDLIVQFRTTTEAPTVEVCRLALLQATAAAWREIERRDRRGPET